MIRAPLLSTFASGCFARRCRHLQGACMGGDGGELGDTVTREAEADAAMYMNGVRGLSVSSDIRVILKYANH